ncbi:MAG: ABC transporter permease [Candidatus Gracilibacteria bacterium]|nr:ABC transporter permease [Candidatus Gracilibacteria bacterium]
MINIALNTFKEIVRNKFLYLILFFAFVFIVFSMALGKLTIGDDTKVIVDFGLAMIEIFGLVGVLFVGSQLLFKEIEGKTIFLILSKPIKRYEFILGKFFGFSATIFLIILLQSILFLIVLLFKDIEISNLIAFSLLFTFFKLEILLGLVFFFSTFMSNMLTILVTLMIYFLSHSFSIILDIANRAGNAIAFYFAQGLQLLFPPFEALNIKDVIGSFKDFDASYFLFNSFYSVIYLSIILFFTVLIFNRKKFEN